MGLMKNDPREITTCDGDIIVTNEEGKNDLKGRFVKKLFFYLDSVVTTYLIVLFEEGNDL